MALNPTTGNKRSTGVASGNNQLSRYSGTLFQQLKSAAVSTYQPKNPNLTSISAIATNISGVLTVVNGTYAASTLSLIGDVTGSISTTSTTLTLSTSGIVAGTYAAAQYDAKGRAIAASDLSGDITTSGGVATTLATVNSNIGTFNSVTVNGKGLVTAASNVIQAPSYQAITATTAQTVFNTTVNTVTNKLMVFNLRTKQIEGTDYTVTGANQITFGVGVTLSNIVEFYSFA